MKLKANLHWNIDIYRNVIANSNFNLSYRLRSWGLLIYLHQAHSLANSTSLGTRCHGARFLGTFTLHAREFSAAFFIIVLETLYHYRKRTRPNCFKTIQAPDYWFLSTKWTKSSKHFTIIFMTTDYNSPWILHIYIYVRLLWKTWGTNPAAICMHLSTLAFRQFDS